jgi:hypothetical protein
MIPYKIFILREFLMDFCILKKYRLSPVYQEEKSDLLKTTKKVTTKL